MSEFNTAPSRVLRLDTGLTVTIPPSGPWASDDDFADVRLRKGMNKDVRERINHAEFTVKQLNACEFDLLRALLGVGHRPTPRRAAWRRRFLGAVGALERLEAAAIDYVLAADGPVAEAWRLWDSPEGLADKEFQSYRPAPDPSPFEDVEPGGDAARKRALVAVWTTLSEGDRQRFLDRFAAAAAASANL